MTSRLTRSRLSLQTVLVAATLLLAGAPSRLPAQPLAPSAPPTSPPPELLPIPHPDLDPLEPQVSDQIREYRDLAQETLDDPESGDGKRAGALGEMGRIYYTYGLTAAAEVCYVNAITLAPQEARWPYYLGMLLQREGRFEEAAQAYRRSLQLDPAYPPTLFYLAEVELAREDAAAAEAALDKYLELEGESAAGWALRGELALSRKDYARAVEHLEKALELFPRANRLHVPLALAHRNLGNMDKARENLARRGSIGARPADPRIDQLEELKEGERVHLIRGRMAFQAGDFDGARDAFDKAVAANPDSVPARVNLGATLSRTGDADGAISQFRRALELDPENQSAHFNMASLYRQQDDLDNARQHLEMAVKLDPDDSAAQLDLAWLLLQQGEPAAALDHFERAEAGARSPADARLGRAKALVALGRHAEAKELLVEANRLVPQDGRIARDLAQILAAAPDPSLREGENAVDLAQRVFQAQQTVDHAELLAQALAEAGRCDEAAALQEQALESARHLEATELEPRLSAALDRYRQGAPCRPPTAQPPEAPPGAGAR